MYFLFFLFYFEWAKWSCQHFRHLITFKQFFPCIFFSFYFILNEPNGLASTLDIWFLSSNFFHVFSFLFILFWMSQMVSPALWTSDYFQAIFSMYFLFFLFYLPALWMSQMVLPALWTSDFFQAIFSMYFLFFLFYFEWAKWSCQHFGHLISFKQFFPCIFFSFYFILNEPNGLASTLDIWFLLSNLTRGPSRFHCIWHISIGKFTCNVHILAYFWDVFSTHSRL